MAVKRLNGVCGMDYPFVAFCTSFILIAQMRLLGLWPQFAHYGAIKEKVFIWGSKMLLCGKKNKLTRCEWLALQTFTAVQFFFAHTIGTMATLFQKSSFVFLTRSEFSRAVNGTEFRLQLPFISLAPMVKTIISNVKNKD